MSARRTQVPLHGAVPSLADLMPSALAAMGVEGFAGQLTLPDSRRVVVLLVDGLGYQALENHRDLLPSVAFAENSALQTAFPTTTPTGLATLGTGALPGHHGFVGASFWLPDLDEELHPLHWGSVPLPDIVQPEPTIFQRATGAGVECVSIGPAAYAGSGLTKSVLRGSRYVAAESVTDRLDALANEWSSSKSATHLTYMYWAPLDRIGHEYGVASDQWCFALQPVDELIRGVRGLMHPGDTLVITADHGMVNVLPENRINVDVERGLWTGVETMLGEPRMRHLYLANRDSVEDVQMTWQAFLGERADVVRREQIATNLWGPLEPGIEDRAGDLMIIARERFSLTSPSRDARVSGLIGQHGALTEDELLVPAVVMTVDV